MQSLKQSILKVVAYFDMFDYPVTTAEIKHFLDSRFTDDAFNFELQQLLNFNIICRMNNFYSLRYDYSLVERRLKGNALAERMLKKAAKVGRLLSWLPYIKGIAVSGSLSKNFAYEGCDLDFFVITSANRLWLLRLYFTLFYQVAKVLGIKDLFCLNYFIDETVLEIPEKNVYTAIEIATLKPLYGKNIFERFYRENNWVLEYLPNCFANVEQVIDKKKSLIKRMIEFPFDNKLGQRLNNFMASFYQRRWKKMLAKKSYTKNGFQFGSYIASAHVCKPMPQYFQGKILMRFEKKMKELDERYYYVHQLAV